MKTTLTAALAILAFAAASPVLAQQGSYAGSHALYQDVAIPSGAAGGGSAGTGTDDVIVDGRIITGENPASARGGAQFNGGITVAAGSDSASGGGSRPPNGKLYVGTDHGVYGASSGGLGDGSVRGLSTGVSSGGFNAPKGSALGSLAGVGSVGQLSSPPGTPPAQATNNIRQLGLASHNYESSRSGGDVNGDGVKDVIVGTGAGAPGGHVKSGPGGGPHVKAIDPSRASGPAIGGAANAKAVGGGNPAVNVGGVTKGFTLTSKGQAR